MRRTNNKLTDYFQWACGVIIMRDGYRKAAWEQFVARDFLVSENLFVQWRTQSKRPIPEVMRDNSAAGKVMIDLGIAKPMGCIAKVDEEKWRQFCVETTSKCLELSHKQAAFADKFSIKTERRAALICNRNLKAPAMAQQSSVTSETPVAAPRLQTIETDIRAYPVWMLDKPCGRTSLREVLSLLEAKYGEDIPQEVVMRLKPQIEALSRQGA
jgi:hypothetical protein